MAANVDAPSSSEPQTPEQCHPAGAAAPPSRPKSPQRHQHQTTANSSAEMGRMNSSPPPPLLAGTSGHPKEDDAAAKTLASPSQQVTSGTNKNSSSACDRSNNGPKSNSKASSSLSKNASASHPLPRTPNERTDARRSSAGQNNAASNRSSSGKQCCFCWCCCYRCACLSSRNQDEEVSKSKDATSKDSWSIDPDMTPSIEEIRCWGDSFDRLMKSPVGRAVFREFLKCEYSEENILFWLACEDLKRDNNPEVVEEKARLIYEDYISILSPKEVSLDSRVREIVNRNMVDPTPHTFDEAQLQIYTLMHRDSYPRFVNSAYYKKLAQLGMSSRKESSA